MNRNICRAADPTVSMCGFQNYHSLYKERTATEITEVNTGIEGVLGFIGKYTDFYLYRFQLAYHTIIKSLYFW